MVTEALFALSSWSSFGGGIVEDTPPLKGFFLAVPFCSLLSLFAPFVAGAGVEAALSAAFVPSLRVIFGAAGGSDNFSLIFGPGTACFALVRYLWNVFCACQ